MFVFLVSEQMQYIFLNEQNHLLIKKEEFILNKFTKRFIKNVNNKQESPIKVWMINFFDSNIKQTIKIFSMKKL